MTFYELKSDKIQPKGIKEDYWGYNYQYGQPLRGVTLTEAGVDYTYNEQSLLDIIYKSPEINAIFHKIVHDIMADGYEITGKNKRLVDDTTEHIDKQWFWDFLEGIINGALRSGNSYAQIVNVSKAQVDKVLAERLKALGLSPHTSQTKAMTELMTAVYPDIKSIFLPKLIDLPSDRMKANFDERGKFQDPSKAYIQQPSHMNPEQVYFSESEIIHFKWNRIDGRFYGESPLNCCIKDINTMLLAKDYQEDFFLNNGTPSNMFTLSESTRGRDDPNYAVLRQALIDLKQTGNKHKNLLLTGKIDVQALNDNKNFNLGEFIMNYCKIIAWVFGLEIGQNKAGDLRVIDDRYYKNLDFFQKCFEIPLNDRFFPIFGKVKFKFNRKYLIDDVREAQVYQMTTGNSLLPLMSLSEARKRAGLPYEENEIPQELKDIWANKIKQMTTDPYQQFPVAKNEDESAQSFTQREGNAPKDVNKMSNKLTAKSKGL